MRKFVAVIAAGALTLAGVFFWMHEEPLTAPAPAHVATPFPFPTPPPPASQAPTAGSNPYSGLTARLANPLENAPSLRVYFERYQNSTDALERWFAARAWTACFPLFLPPTNGAATIEQATRALSVGAPDYAERVEAYRMLMGRCKGFLDLPRATLVAQSAQISGAIQADTLQSPGAHAHTLVQHGQPTQAAQLARTILSADDGYALDSLRDYVFDILSARAERADLNSGLAPSPPAMRPDLRALTLSVTACDLRLACGPASLSALQRCANSGQCSGDLRQRLLQDLTPAEQRSVLQASAELRAALRSHDFTAVDWLAADGR